VNWQDVVLGRDGVEVRPWQEGDAEAVGTSPRDPMTGHYFGRALNAPPPGTGDPEAPMFAILRFGAPVGRIWFRPGIRPFEVGYYVRTDLWGQGIATRALSIVAAWMLDENGVEEIALFTHPENFASHKVAERAGFVRDGIREDYAEFKDGTFRGLRFVRRRT